jgi:uncharacterized protein YdhG (YjbR/CyaY superfamily)
MVSSTAATPEAYIAELPPERAEAIRKTRDLVNANLPAGYVERMSYGMIGWEVPLERYPQTYNGQPLAFAALAAQKNYNALYLNCVSASAERTQRLKDAYAAAGKKLDMGKSCIRFKRADELADEVIANEIRSTPVADFIAEYEASRAR